MRRLLTVLWLTMAMGAFGDEAVVMASTSPALRPLGEALVPVYQDAGLSVEFREWPGGRLAAEAQAGRPGAITVVSEGFLADLSAHYLGLGFDHGPLAVTNLCQYVLKGTEASFLPDPSTWAGKRVGVLRAVGPTATDAFLQGVGNVQIVEAPSYAALAKMLQGGRYDFFVAPLGGVEPDLAALGLQDQIVRQPKPLLTIRYYHAVNRNLGPKAAALEAALGRHRAEVEKAVAAILGR